MGKVKNFVSEYFDEIKSGLVTGICTSIGVYGTYTLFALVWKKLGFCN